MNKSNLLKILFKSGLLLVGFIHYVLANNYIEFSEVMYRPVGARTADQFIEFVIMTDSVSLRSAHIAVGNSSHNLVPETGNPVVKNGYMLLFCTDYNRVTGRYEALIPQSVPRFYINSAQFGTSGISSQQPTTILLLDSAYRTLAQFTTIIPCTSGHSMERKLLQPRSNEANWFFSNAAEGTPGTRNSISPPRKDIGIAAVTFSPVPGTLGTPLLRAQLVGNGEFSVSSRVVARYRRFPEQAPSVTDTTTSALLDYGCSRFVDLPLTGLSAGPLGWVGYKVSIHIPDDVPANDTASGESYYWKSVTPLVTEWMCVPATNEPQWLEFLWQGAEPAQFAGWQLRVGTGTVTLPFHPESIPAGSRFVISEAPIPTRYQADSRKVIVVPNWRSWGTHGADIAWVAPWGQITEELPFSDSYPVTPVAGRSLVRRSPNVPAALASNWYVSCDSAGATPANTDAPDTSNSNSPVVTVSQDNAKLETKRFAPQGYSGLSDKMILTGQTTGGNFSIEIYDLSGSRHYKRNETLLFGLFQLEWNGRDNGGSLVATGVYIVILKKNGSQLLRQSVVVVR